MADVRIRIPDPPPADQSELTFRAIATTTPHHVDSHGTDAIEVAPDILRSESVRCEFGPCCETARAKIGA